MNEPGGRKMEAYMKPKVEMMTSRESQINFARVAYIIFDIMTDVLRDLLSFFHNPRLPLNLPENVKLSAADKKTLENIKVVENFNECGIPLLYVIIRHVRGIPPPSNGWGKLVHGVGVGDDVERIRHLRNEFLHGTSTATMDENEYTRYIQETRVILSRFDNCHGGTYQTYPGSGTYLSRLTVIETKSMDNKMVDDIRKQISASLKDEPGGTQMDVCMKDEPGGIEQSIEVIATGDRRRKETSTCTATVLLPDITDSKDSFHKKCLQEIQEAADDITVGFKVNLKSLLPVMFKCPFCQLLIRDAVQTFRGERACETCYYTAKDKGDRNVCPIDSEPITDEEIFKDIYARREILQLPTYCNNKHHGCTWEGVVMDVTKHRLQCTFECIPCDLCTDCVQRKDMDVHRHDVCLFRLLHCGYCQEMFQAQLLREHEPRCPRRPTKCPYECGENIGLEDMYEHVQNCSKLDEGIVCPYELIGCKWRHHEKARGMSDEEEVSKRIHNMEISGRIDVVQKRSDQTTGRIDDMEKRSDQTTGRIEDVRKRIDQTTGQIDDVQKRNDQTTGQIDVVQKRSDQTTGRIGDTEKRSDQTTGRIEDVRKRRRINEDDEESLETHMERSMHVHAALTVQNITYLLQSYKVMNEEVLSERTQREHISKQIQHFEKEREDMTVQINLLHDKVFDMQKECEQMKGAVKSGVGEVEENMNEVLRITQANNLKDMNEKLEEIKVHINDVDTKTTQQQQQPGAHAHDMNSNETKKAIGQIDDIEDKNAVMSANLADVELKLQLLENTSYDGRQLWKIDNIEYRRSQAISGKVTALHSAPWHEKRGGYKFCARLYLNGDGMGRGTHVSLFFVIMKSEFDALLKWPFDQRVTLRLINPYDQEESLQESFIPDKNSSSFKMPKRDMNIAAGCPMFVRKEELVRYIIDDSLFIEVKVTPS